MNKIKKLFAGIACAALMIPGMAMAAVMVSNGNIAQGETIPENAYVAGGNPVIAGTVQGDLLASGGNVYVSGTVFQDAMLAGGTVNMTGHITGDLRIFAGTIMVDGPVDGELMAMGGNVMIGPRAIIRGDVNIASGKVHVDPAAQMLSSKINIQNGEKENEKGPKTLMMDTNKFLTVAFWIAQLMFLAAVLVVVLIVHFVFPGFTKTFVHESSDKTFWKSFLVGLLMFIVMPIAAIIAFITGIGAFLGVLILIAYIGLIIASMLFAGVVFGGLLYQLIKKPKKFQMSWGWVILGVIALHIVGLLPIVGWVIGLVFFLAAWGAMASLKWKQMRKM